MVENKKEIKKKKASSKGKILLVEDDDFVSGMYSTKLTMAGYDVAIAVDGKEGLKMAKQENPDLILLDIVLPKIDGFQVLERIKKDQTLKEVPVILLTNLGQKEDVERGLGLGADDYTIKAHFTPNEVIQKIENLLLKRKKN